MFKIINNEFKLLYKYKELIKNLDNLIENIPRKDYFYKDKIRTVSNYILELIVKYNYSCFIPDLLIFKNLKNTAKKFNIKTIERSTKAVA